jgi:hypothetical protein
MITYIDILRGANTIWRRASETLFQSRETDLGRSFKEKRLSNEI